MSENMCVGCGHVRAHHLGSVHSLYDPCHWNGCGCPWYVQRIEIKNANGVCTERMEGIGDVAWLLCELPHGHGGMHHDGQTGADWIDGQIHRLTGSKETL